LTLPYYPSELDAVGGIQNSLLWDANIWGSWKVDSPVTDGVFSDPAWICTVNNSIGAGPADAKLKRHLTVSNNLKDGPCQIGWKIGNYSQYWNFTTYLENGPHQAVHTTFAYPMITMASPNEPTFFMHHCNMDRLYHLWADCWGYETIPSSQLTNLQYQAENPDTYLNGIPPKASIDWRTNQPYDVGIDSCVIHYYWDYSPAVNRKSTIISIVFPDSGWPTPRKMWPIGDNPNDPSEDGLNYRYGLDDLCNLTPFNKTCDPTWRWVNQPLPGASKKRVEEEVKDSYIEKLNEQYEAKIQQGKDLKEAFYELAMEECESIPSERDTKAEKAWFSMMGGAPPSRICDKPKALTGENGDMAIGAKKDSQIPAWVVAVSAFAAVVGIVIAVIVVVIVVKKRKAPQDNLYVDLMSNQN